MRRRALWRGLGLVVVGMALTVLVSWGIAFAHGWWGLPMRKAAAPAEWIIHRPSWPAPTEAEAWRGFGRRQTEVRRRPGETEKEGLTYPQRRFWMTHRQVSDAYGFPMPALRRSLVSSDAAGTIDEWSRGEQGWLETGVGIALPDDRNGWPRSWRLALRPMWPGFVVNTLVYGALIGVLVYGLQTVRGRSRRRRGRCPACGYEVAGLGVCPECGRPVAGGNA